MTQRTAAASPTIVDRGSRILGRRPVAPRRTGPTTLTIGTASPGGTYHAYGEGLARLLTRKLGLLVTTRPKPKARSKTSSCSKPATSSWPSSRSASPSRDGTAPGTGPADSSSAARARCFRCTTRHSSSWCCPTPRIQSVADLAGKQVGIGPQGGTGGVYTPLVFKALKTDANFVTGSWTDMAAQLSARKLDALVVVAGVPVPEVTELEKKGNIRNLTLTPSQTVAIAPGAAGDSRRRPIAAGTYPSLRRHYPTIGMYNFAVARADLPDDLVYAILETVFNNPDDMMQIHPAAAETVPANFTRNTILPFHEGAARWYNNKATIGVVRGD